jgi:DNA-binding protein H-NS
MPSSPQPQAAPSRQRERDLASLADYLTDLAGWLANQVSEQKLLNVVLMAELGSRRQQLDETRLALGQALAEKQALEIQLVAARQPQAALASPRIRELERELAESREAALALQLSLQSLRADFEELQRNAPKRYYFYRDSNGLPVGPFAAN